MDGYLVQNTMNTFSEAKYNLNVNIMVIFDYHSNIIGAALGLELYCPVRTQGNKSSAYKAIAVLLHDLPFIERLIGLDVVVGEGVWYFLKINYLAHFRIFH